ncbi:flagellar filament capping protein FliD [Escherichia albertii]|uniref:flagellar filament capping protein FliD n=1 Tax=Escherichia albertii TaxID=208962 RepID=UPI0002BC7067|nr:flagellar filament capping protein FliD [Escherichia albertii]EFX6077099.1 flagellar filament capping protein FliD [Shigella boydii]MCZ8870340.1 flagellar filament capping protein FliD [Escherichia albertii]
MASISSLGVGSGLDLSSILDSLTAAQKATLTPISNQQSSFTAKLSAYGTLKSALTTFQTTNTALSKADLFSATSTTSSTTAFSATTAGNAITGKYTISVTHLAQAQTLTTSTTRDDTKTAIAASDSKLTIQQGGNKDPITIDISAANSSLSAIRDAINNAKAGVSASIINVGNSEYRLSVTSNDTGIDNAMTLSVSGDDALQSFMSYGASSNGMEVSVVAQNAQLTVNNVAIENSSNTISDALENITLNLNDVTTGNQTLTITQDTAKAQSAIKDWVNAYNSLIDNFSSLTKYTAVDAGSDSQSSDNGALPGDSTLRTIQTQLKSMLSNTVSSSNYKTLAQMGITTDPSNGKLELDADKLTAALKKDASGVGALIVGDGKKTGITTTIGANLTSWLSTTGIIKAATDGVSKTLNKLTKDYNAASDRIDAQVARYKEQFTQLDVLMTSLNSTSSYLTQQFENNSSSKITAVPGNYY